MINCYQCPFCGCEDIRAYGDRIRDYYYGCAKCSGRTGLKITVEEAIKAWNTRKIGVCIWKYHKSFEYATSECGSMDTHRIDFKSLRYCPYCSKKIEIQESEK